MLKIRSLITAFLIGMIFTSIVHADMVAISTYNGERSCSKAISNHLDNQYSYLYNSVVFSDIDDLYPLVGLFPQEATIDVSGVPYNQNLIELRNEPSSFSLCLYALIGMGFCGSAHWMKKHSFGFIPEWYHSGGPYQIGHSFAVTPDCFRTAPVFCFIQPVYTVEDSIPRYRQRTVVSLWRESQFTPEQIASRGPPLS